MLPEMLCLLQGMLRGPAVWEVIRTLFSDHQGGAGDMQFLVRHPAVTITIAVESERELVRALDQAEKLRTILEDPRNLPFDPGTVKLAGYADGSWRIQGDDHWFEYAGGDDLRPYQQEPLSDEGFRAWFHETFGFDPEDDTSQDRHADGKPSAER